MQHQINTLPITQFSQLLRAAELGQQKEIKIPIQQARLLNLTLLEMLDKINVTYEHLLSDLKNSLDTDVISVTMDGGGFDTKK